MIYLYPGYSSFLIPYILSIYFHTIQMQAEGRFDIVEGFCLTVGVASCFGREVVRDKRFCA